MITCREDLYNTYVKAKDKELLTVFMRTFMDKLPDRADYSLDDYVESVSSFEVVMILPHYRSPQIATSKTDLSKLRELTMADFIPSNDVKYYDKDEEVKPQDGFVSNAIKDFKVSHKLKTKEQSMSDNKAPRARTEYIKLNKNDKNGKYWEVARDFAESESYACAFYCLVNTSYFPVVSNERLLSEYEGGNLYRKVEKQITWHDDVIDHLESFGGDECKTFIEAITENKNTGVNGYHYDVFINMCRFVVESVDKK